MLNQQMVNAKPVSRPPVVGSPKPAARWTVQRTIAIVICELKAALANAVGSRHNVGN